MNIDETYWAISVGNKTPNNVFDTIGVHDINQRASRCARSLSRHGGSQALCALAMRTRFYLYWQTPESPMKLHSPALSLLSLALSPLSLSLSYLHAFHKKGIPKDIKKTLKRI